jgi:penicillin V acylase-like amidase (Ntn superfamily)
MDLSRSVVMDGVNDAGLALNTNAFSETGETPDSGGSGAVLEAADLGRWLLGNFSSVAAASAALAKQPVNATRMPIAANVPFPLHIMITDSTGASATIEGKDGIIRAIDNPIGVMTNDPPFDWHLVNLDNWSHLSNVDHSSGTFGALAVTQPDSGIATSALPASNTSVGRFVRATYYTNFVEKVKDADAAITTLSAIINNFDRPRGATVDPPGGKTEGVNFGAATTKPSWTTEYTTFTFMADITRGRYYLRPYTCLNWSTIDLTKLTGATGPKTLPMGALDSVGGDVSEILLNA